MTKLPVAYWLVPAIVALTFGSIIGVVTAAVINLIATKTLSVLVPVWILLTIILTVTIGATIYQRYWTIPRLSSKGDLTGTACHCLALVSLGIGVVLKAKIGAPAATPLVLMALGYAAGIILHTQFKPRFWTRPMAR